ncbi:MAG: phosphoribosylaminoimidazolesuccinocarboxamide synthase [Rhodospirillaceae bacterium]
MTVPPRSAIGPELLRRALCYRLTEVDLPELPNHYRGKVRDNYSLPDGRRVLVATDRQSAFDRVLAAVPFKGQVLTQIARYWFERTADICPNHVLSYPDPNVLVARDLTMLPVEMVVRDYLTGSTDTSIWTAYAAGSRLFCGNRLPDGMVKNAKLPETMLTPSTKPEDGSHDVSVSPDDLITGGYLTPEQWHELAEVSLRLFARGRELAAANGLILVDTKYEFGLDRDGHLTLADEIHTPDSSRYWFGDSYAARHAAGQEPESLDKEFLRLWLRERGNPYTDPIPEIPDEVLIDFASRYIRLYETVTGQAFRVPDMRTPILERIRAALEGLAPQALEGAAPLA